jgi:ABC-type sugar transport system substrate-binding protein
MTRHWIAICTVVTALIAATIMFALALSVTVREPVKARTRVLLISGGTSGTWERMAAGARAAADQLGIELQIRTPTTDNRPEEQAAIVHTIDFANCDGIAFCPANPASQLHLVNEIALQTRLVTIGNDENKTKSLCQVKFSSRSISQCVARLMPAEAAQGRTIALISTIRPDMDRNAIVDESLSDFVDSWPEFDQHASTMLCRLTADDHDKRYQDFEAGNRLSTAVSNSELACIVAFDAAAAESALAILAQQPRSKCPPVIAAFAPIAVTLDAIENGRIYAAISDDPYRIGYAAVAKIDKLCNCGEDHLPVPGYGSICVNHEVVQKTTLPDFRRQAKSWTTSSTGSVGATKVNTIPTVAHKFELRDKV